MISKSTKSFDVRELDVEISIHLRSRIAEAHKILMEAHEKYDPVKTWGLLSGGHDSIVSTHVTASSGIMDDVVHINTGIGIDETRQYVRDSCDQYGWNLLEYRAVDYINGKGEKDPQVYEELVSEFGFPGPNHHQKMYDRLKGRPLAQAIREHKTHRMDKIMLCTGIRNEESTRRMGYKDPVDIDGAKVWVNPLLSWTKRDCQEYMQTFGLPSNEVVKILCMSGECLCGAFAKENELTWVEQWYPKAGEYIRGLEKRVKDLGFPWGWDEKPPAWWGKFQQGQDFLPGMKPTGVTRHVKSSMCTTCEFKHEKHEEEFGEYYILSNEEGR